MEIGLVEEAEMDLVKKAGLGLVIWSERWKRAWRRKI